MQAAPPPQSPSDGAGPAADRALRLGADGAPTPPGGRRIRRPEVHRPPTGVAVAALLVFGLRYWPGIALGTLGVVL
ncbi:hypothetical protein SHIRM173S_08470 [Streptomyces hirsutus]